MLDDVVPERRARHLGLREQLGRLGQGGRQPLRSTGIGVSRQRVGQFQPVIDAVQTTGDQRRHGQVLVDVAAGRPAFHPHTGTVTDYTQRTGTVVHPPGDGSGREAAVGKPFVGVDVRRVEQCQLAQCGQYAGDEAAEHRRHSVRAGLVGEDRRPVLATQRDVDMAAVAFAFIEFRHERQALAVLIGDLLGTVLVDGVVVAGGAGMVVPERDLLLAQVALALDAFAVQSGTLHAQTDVAQQRLHPGGRHHGVVDVVVAGRCQVAVSRGPGLAECVVEHHEFELGPDVGHQLPLGQPVDLAVQDAARSLLDGATVQPRQIRHHQGGARQPGDQPQGAEVGGHHHVAVAGVPTRHRVATDGVHVDLDREQVVTTLRTVGGDLFDEQPARNPLTGQPALHIAEGDDDGVDLTRRHHLLQVGSCQHAGVLAHCAPSCPCGTRWPT